MHSKQRRKANRNFLMGARKEILVFLGDALMNGGVSRYPTFQESWASIVSWTKIRKKIRSAGLIDNAGKITEKGMRYVSGIEE